MQVTQHFKENWERSNEWLKENAPDYVFECVEELSHHMILAIRELEKVQKALDEIESK